MRIVIFGPGSVRALPDRGEGSARFLRTVSHELTARGHSVAMYGPNAQLDLELALDGLGCVLVHDGTAPELTSAIRRHHAGSGAYRLFFYDTYSRAATAPPELRRFNLAGFDGVLAASEAIRRSYVERGWGDRAWTWHEAVDPRAFAPRPGVARTEDLVWIGSRCSLGCSLEVGTMLLEPARRLGLTGVVHGDYPWRARAAIQRSGLRYGGPLADHLLPAVLARHRFTVELPQARHVLAGLPPTRVFEALACGVPMICSPWGGLEQLFEPGRDHLLVRDQREMEAAMRTLRGDRALADELAHQGRATVLARHTVAQRVDELMAILSERSAGDPAAIPGSRRAAGAARFHAWTSQLGENPPDGHYGSGREVGAK